MKKRTNVGKAHRKLQPEALEPRQLLSADPIVVDADHLFSDPHDGVTTLREALVLAASEQHPGPDTITFAPSLNFGTIQAGSGELVVDSDVTIDASTAGLLRIGNPAGRGNIDHRIFRIANDVQVVMKNVIVQGGVADQWSPLGNFGAGIHNAGSLRLENSVVGGNTQFAAITTSAGIQTQTLGGGAGIYNAPTGIVELSNSHVGALTIDSETLADLNLDETNYSKAKPVGATGRAEAVPNNIAQGVGAGILNRGILRILNDSTVAYNRANFHGSGIYNVGSVEIQDSQISYNQIFGSEEGVDGPGIASSHRLPTHRRANIYGDVDDPRNGFSYQSTTNPVSLRIDQSRIDHNRGSGGAIHVEGSSVFIANSEIHDNSSSGLVVSTNATATVLRSLVEGNAGSGVAVSLGQATIDGSTIVGNAGTGVSNSFASARITNSTLTQNRNGINSLLGTGGTRIYNSILVGNSSTDVIGSLASAAVPSDGFNLVGTIDGNIALRDTDRRTTNAGLGSLGDYGGPTRSISLLPGSPALNTGPTAVALGDATSDQRGESRIVGPRADRGAFESQPLLRMEVDSLSGAQDGYYAPGQVSLADAVAWANEVPGPDSITFSEQLIERIRTEMDGSATVELLAQLTITDDLTILGPGANTLAYSGRDRHRVFQVMPGVSLDLRDLTVTQGRSSSGGGIKSEGAMTLHGVEVRDSYSTDLGGGIWSGAGSSLVMTASTIAGNRADRGGGLYISRDARIENSTIAENTATQHGGGFLTASSATITIDHTTITRNDGGAFGGGFRAQSDAVVQLSNTVVAGNQASRDPDYSDETDAVSFGFNLIGDIDEATSPLRSFSTEIGDVFGGGTHVGALPPIDPLLGPLRDLGGTTRTIGLLPTSPLMDAAAAMSSQNQDQRGFHRPFADRDDIGAFEYVPPAYQDGHPITIDSVDGLADGYFAAGELSFAEAVLFANEIPGPNTIAFAAHLFQDEDGNDVPRQISPDRTLIIADEITIQGPGANLLTILGGQSSDMFSISETGTAFLSDVTIDGAAQSRAISNAGVLQLERTYVTNAKADQGAGLLNTGSATVQQSTFANQ